MSSPYHPKSKFVPSSGFDTASASFDFSNVTNRGKVKTEGGGGDDDASHTSQISNHSKGSKVGQDVDHEVDNSDGDVDDFMAQFAAAFSKMMKGEGSRKSRSKRQEPSIVLPSGMGFRLGDARSRDEIRTGRTIVKRNERGTSSESRAKFIRKVCVKLENPLKLPPWEEILDSSSDLDLGTAVIDVQTQIEGVVEFCILYDVYYVANVPCVDDMWDERQLKRCKVWTNVLTNYQSLDLETVKEYQALVNSHGLDVDLESSEMLFKVLEKSTEITLWQMLKQTYLTWHPAEQGGVSMFKLLMDKLDNPSFEQLQNGVNYIISFKLSDTPGENVPHAIVRFTAVVKSLPSTSIPPKTVNFFLEGMLRCGNEDFKDVVKAQRGILLTIAGKQLAREPVLVQLEIVGSPLVEKYNALVSTNEWGAVATKASAFRTSAYKNTSPPNEKQPTGERKKKHEYDSFEEWFDNCTCDRCGRRGHPTYAHGNVEAHRKKEVPRRPRKSGPKLKFKSKKDKGQFEKAVHKAMLEYMADPDGLDEEEEDLYANIAGENSNVKDESKSDSEGDESDDDEGVSALVACALKNLVKD
jgi:hypothetical protein